MVRIPRMLLVTALTTASWADPLPDGVSAKAAALLERMAGQLETDVAAMTLAKGKCDQLAAAVARNADADSKVFADLVAQVTADGEAAFSKYAQAKYKVRLKNVAAQGAASTVGCRTDARVIAAWKANKMIADAVGALPPEPEPEPVKPPDYDAKTKKLDAALVEFRAAAASVAAAKSCAAGAKLVPRFRAARDKLFAAHDALDKPTQQYSLKDKSKDDMDAALSWVETHGRCKTDKAFAAAVTKARL